MPPLCLSRALRGIRHNANCSDTGNFDPAWLDTSSSTGVLVTTFSNRVRDGKREVLVFANREHATYRVAGCGARRLKEETFDIVLALGRSAHADVFHVTARVHAQWMQIRYGNPVERALQRLNPRHRAVLEIEQKRFRPTRRRVASWCSQNSIDNC